MRREVVAEGNVDRAILKAICPECEIPTPEPKEQGREAAMRRAATAVKQIGARRIVLVLDRNGRQPEQIQEEVERTLRSVWQAEASRKGRWYVFGESALRIVPAGLPGDPLLAELGVHRYMSDDYLVRLLLADEALRAFCGAEQGLAYRLDSAERLKAILVDLIEALRKNGVTVDSSKRLVHLIAVTLGFPASRSELASRLISKSPPNLVEVVLGGLRKEVLEDPPL